MKLLYRTLLSATALMCLPALASAGEIDQLRTQIEALNGRIANLETAPAIPAGYQLLSISDTRNIILPDTDAAKFFGTTGTQIGIMPTADVPASTTIVWTGFVSTALTYVGESTDGLDLNADGDFVDAGEVRPTESDSIDIMSKAGLNVTGTTDTAVGEVGASITLLADANTVIGGNNRGHDSSVATDGFKGWWKITPELELSGGVFGSAAKNGKGWKGECSCYYLGEDPTGHFGTNLNNDPAQIRLTYKSGPIAFAIAVEDYDNVASTSRLGVAGEMKWSGDGFGFELNAGFWDSAVAATDSNWTVNAGANFGLGDIGALSAAIGVGEDRHTFGNGDRYTKGSIMATFNLSDSMSLELGGAYRDYKARNDLWAVGGGLYYQPVSQLTIGLEGLYSDEDGPLAVETMEAAIVTVYRF